MLIKSCTKCNYVYDAIEWARLPIVGIQGDKVERLDLRTCVQADCRSTLALVMPEDVSVCLGCGKWLGAGQIKTYAPLGVICESCAARSALVPRYRSVGSGMY
jgi:hypothetical protein